MQQVMIARTRVGLGGSAPAATGVIHPRAPDMEPGSLLVQWDIVLHES